MIRVSARTPVADDVAKARAIVALGDAVMFTGDARHLRKMAQQLRAHAGTEAFLGDGEQAVVLHVAPAGPVGALLVDRVRRD